MKPTAERRMRELLDLLEQIERLEAGRRADGTRNHLSAADLEVVRATRDAIVDELSRITGDELLTVRRRGDNLEAISLAG